MQTKPTHEFGELRIVVVRKLSSVNQIKGSTKQARRNVRVFIDLSTNKSDEHQVHHLRTSSKYLVAFERDWLREKESNLQLRVQSPTCCQLHHPQEVQVSGHWDSNPEPCADLALATAYKAAAYQLNCVVDGELVAVEGIEPTSLDYQLSALAVELHREQKGSLDFVLWSLNLRLGEVG